MAEKKSDFQKGRQKINTFFLSSFTRVFRIPMG